MEIVYSVKFAIASSSRWSGRPCHSLALKPRFHPAQAGGRPSSGRLDRLSGDRACLWISRKGGDDLILYPSAAPIHSRAHPFTAQGQYAVSLRPALSLGEQISSTSVSETINAPSHPPRPTSRSNIPGIRILEAAAADPLMPEEVPPVKIAATGRRSSPTGANLLPRFSASHPADVGAGFYHDKYGRVFKPPRSYVLTAFPTWRRCQSLPTAICSTRSHAGERIFRIFQ